MKSHIAASTIPHKSFGAADTLRTDNSAGCLDACEHGVTVVVYPEQIWYGKVTVEDVEEIIQEHIIKNSPVERLKIRDEKFNRDKNKF